MPRLPLLAGSRMAVVNAASDAVVLAPPAPREPIADVAAAVRDALRFPLSGPPLEALAVRGGRATVVVEPASLPLPGVPHDPRQAALAAALDELGRLGVAPEAQTILVAGGLGRRAGQKEREALLEPARARGFRGRVEVHDCEDDRLVPLGEVGGMPLRVSRALLETDVVVTISAAETVLHGGAATLLSACGAETLAAATTDSLLETTGSRGWQLAVGVERALAGRVALIGASLVLDHPRLTGPYRAFPFERESYGPVARSPLRRLTGALPGAARRALLDGLARELNAVAAYGGPPSVAHAEALLRGVELRGTRLDRPLDALVVPVPWFSPHVPRERLNPITVAALGLGLALRLWRDTFPVADDGTVVLLHRFSRHFSHATQQPYRTLYGSLRDGRDAERLAELQDAASRDARALAAYRNGRACHPLLPFSDWISAQPAIRRLGSVVIAGCRDAQAARTLGFVPTHGTGAALTMAYGRAPADARVGFLMAPPYPPLIVGGLAQAP